MLHQEEIHSASLLKVLSAAKRDFEFLLTVNLKPTLALQSNCTLPHMVSMLVQSTSNNLIISDTLSLALFL